MINHRRNALIESLQDAILGEADLCRRQVMNLFESHLGKSENWPTIRKQLLNIFGERGFSGGLSAVIEEICCSQRRL